MRRTSVCIGRDKTISGCSFSLTAGVSGTIFVNTAISIASLGCRLDSICSRGFNFTGGGTTGDSGLFLSGCSSISNAKYSFGLKMVTEPSSFLQLKITCGSPA